MMNRKCFLAADIGGSHITAALVDAENGSLIKESMVRARVDAQAQAHVILKQWIDALKKVQASVDNVKLGGIGFAMPGPFDYTNGISLIEGVCKYHSLYGVNVRQCFVDAFGVNGELSVCFENDASCFALGEAWSGSASAYSNVIALTLGTGFGSTFMTDGKVIHNGSGVPDGGYLYNWPFREGMAEDYISTRWLVKEYNSRSGNDAKDAREIQQKVEEKDAHAIAVFKEFGETLAECIAPWIQSFKADCVVIGGNITQAAGSFMPHFQHVLDRLNISIPCTLSNNTEQQAIAGAALVVKRNNSLKNNDIMSLRKTTQPLLPVKHNTNGLGHADYDIYPAATLGAGKIKSGYDTLATWIATHKTVLIDGFGGNDWNSIRNALSSQLQLIGKRVLWYEMSAFRQSEEKITQLVQPFIGTPGTVWGKRATIQLADYYDIEKLQSLSVSDKFDIVILIGEGAALSNWNAPVIYIDLPKDEIQYRMQAKSIRNLGASTTDTNEEMYKRFYFVDWVVLFNHKQSILDKIAIIADGQQVSTINWSLAQDIRDGVHHLAKNVLRARPWFAAGAWGGQWMKEKIKGLNKDEINYAWSFELIVPENGLVFKSDGWLLEIAFDWLMLLENKSILGADAERFGTEFPIRFDFLDTFDGGNLSIQCHPSLKYIQENFGETITQDETYYILDCKDDAQVYLGFQENINKEEFREALNNSVASGEAIEIEQYVQKFPAKKHDLFLIPNGTIHSSGANNMVLEISATPYIFTFKMYDWVRPGLDGKPRPINIEHAFNNLNFERNGDKVCKELISKPEILEKKDAYTLVHVPTHPEHFYDVHRMEFDGSIEVQTENKAHVLMVVEGASVIVETAGGEKQEFSYAETFVIPAAAGSYKLTNGSSGIIKIVKAFVK
ncbi:ROK family protein [Danxiaibacter flavus]|uniref:ROK family protein n=1 Tax=Danxiaibacter flavus TaxID=3049108 RepID=A0ABV3ZFX3_9BACT|nr:ROK family protein [Chitinophagaceae bacterium DXS]